MVVEASSCANNGGIALILSMLMLEIVPKDSHLIELITMDTTSLAMLGGFHGQITIVIVGDA
jgi:hypothetical protein